MRNTYILDTSALVYDPSLYKSYPYSDLIIPIAVLGELDELKKQPGDTGRNARVAIRWLDEISNNGDISTGVLLDYDVLVKVDASYYDLKDDMFAGLGDPTYGDTQILACAMSNKKNHFTHDITLVSNDINLRIKAKARGIDAQSHEGSKYSLNELYAGHKTVVDDEAGIAIQTHGVIHCDEFGLDLNPNEYVLFQSSTGDGIAMGRKIANQEVKLLKKRHHPWGISPRNKEQTFAIDLLMDKSVDLVTLTGRAGTGKSLIVLASALELVLSKKVYDKFIIYRPIQAVGNDIGYLPGTMEEKLAPWFQAIMDNMETLFSFKNGDSWKRELETYQRKGAIEMEAITYIRGRSIPNSIILIDECQNLTREEVKTILTRAGEGTKIVLTGDIEQIDNSTLDATNNGLTHVIEKFKDSELAGHITFTHGERSKLASRAAELL
jgi:PhoH-like ATPase